MAAFFLAAVAAVKAQDTKSKNKNSSIDLTSRANDHFVLQFGYTNMGSVPDSIHSSGFSRFFNFYLMFDKPFKSNPHLSLGIGAGVGTDNYFFKNQYIDLKSNASKLPFRPYVPGTDSSNFKKYKLATMFVDVPLELRYAANPVQPDKGFKASLGLKFGYLLKGYTKGKNLQNKSGNSVYGGSYIMKESDKNYLNSTRIVAIGRIGYGNFSLSGAYQLTSVLKSGAGPDIRPFSIGLTVSGL